jgi:hypothetical protein
VEEATMSFRLVLTEQLGPGPQERDAGEDLLFDDLPAEHKVYALYYPATMPNEDLENKLLKLGRDTGKNLFVNIGQRSDPHLDKIVELFGINSYPVIIVTAADGLASPAHDHMTVFARLDNRDLLRSPEKTVECVEELFSLFIQGRVSEAIAKGKWTQRAELVSSLTQFFTDALKSLWVSIAGGGITISFLEGMLKLKLKPGGG